MKPSKYIKRNENSTINIFDNRSLKVDYRTLQPLLKKGMSVLDIGCGTGSLSKDVANIVGPTGRVTGIDNAKKFIKSGLDTYKGIKNLKLIHVDLFDFEPVDKYDLVIAARVLQWQSDPKGFLLKIKSLLKPDGQISILDYNHEKIKWQPEPPESMLQFYKIFLKWRKEADFNNNIIQDIPKLFQETGFRFIEKINSDEYNHRGRPDFISKVSIWSKVASSKQMVEEGYLDNDLRLMAIEAYDKWVKNEAISMTMKLNEVRGKVF
jgi:ubiquinone/menaquinone biosynthesis C-methylase UbiE